MVIAAVVLPVGSLGGILGSGGVTIPRSPTVICFARDSDAVYYSFILVISIIIGTGVSLIAIILRVIAIEFGCLKKKPKVKKWYL